MKKLFSFVSLMLVLIIVCANIPSTPKQVNAATKKVQVLFIGNSKTLSYGSPAKSFEALANNNGKNVEVTICGYYGYSLHDIVTDNNYANIIKNGKWDIVIMQEAIYPYLGEAYTDKQGHKMTAAQSSAEYANSVSKIAEWTRNKNKNVKLYVRQVWLGKEYGTVNQIAGAGQSTGKFYIRDTVTRKTADKNRAYSNTEKIAASVNASVIYDGYIMGAYNNKYIKLEDNLFRPDNYHQTRYGSAVAATVIYAAVYNSMPTIRPTYFQHGLDKYGKPRNSQSNNVFVTPEQIERIKFVVKDKYGWK